MWPLRVLLWGFPVWWLLGVASFVPVLLAVPMAREVVRRLTVRPPGEDSDRARLPPGTTWWALFLVWVVLGVLLLGVDAPGAVPGGGGSRLLVFGFRLAWYLTCGVVLLWVATLDRRTVSDEVVLRPLGVLFAVTVAGGLVGLLAPELELRSPFEALLPGSVSSNPFVASLVHVQVADVQTVLGRPEPRPKAPFPYTNTWGSCLSLTLVAWCALRWRSRWSRVLAGSLVVVALVPVAFSLNRGLWATLAVGLVGLLLLGVSRRDARSLALLVVAALVTAVLLVASPLGTLVSERFEHQHSNDRRSQLLEATVSSVSQGSPVLGFGSTRDVQGSFASITGAATPDCPACGVPPLGTQGQLWLVLFSQGWAGLVLFLGFLATALGAAVRCRTRVEVVATFVTGFFVLQLPVYDTLGMPLLVVMVVLGLAARQRAVGADAGPAQGRARQPWGRGAVAAVLLVPVLGGAGAGSLLHAVTDQTRWRAVVSIETTPAPVYLDTGGTTAVLAGMVDTTQPRDVTVDTEAALLLARDTVLVAAREAGRPAADLRDGAAITAPPSSQVLDLRVEAADATGAAESAEALAAAYLVARDDFLSQRRDDLLARLRQQRRELDATDPAQRDLRARLDQQVDRLLTGAASPGRVLRRSPAFAVRPSARVPVVSGAAIGLLLGSVLIRRRPLRRRP